MRTKPQESLLETLGIQSRNLKTGSNPKHCEELQKASIYLCSVQ
jgi:hypothetical protein